MSFSLSGCIMSPPNWSGWCARSRSCTLRQLAAALPRFLSLCTWTFFRAIVTASSSFFPSAVHLETSFTKMVLAAHVSLSSRRSPAVNWVVPRSAYFSQMAWQRLLCSAVCFLLGLRRHSSPISTPLCALCWNAFHSWLFVSHMIFWILPTAKAAVPGWAPQLCRVLSNSAPSRPCLVKWSELDGCDLITLVTSVSHVD